MVTSSVPPSGSVMRVLVPFTASRKSTSRRYCASCPRMEKRLPPAPPRMPPLSPNKSPNRSLNAPISSIAGGRAVARALIAAGIFAIIALLRPLLAARVDLAAVVAPALLLIADDVIGGGDLLELLLGRLVARIEVGVQLLGELAIGLGDVGGAGGLRHAKYGIEIVCHLPVEALEWSGSNRITVMPGLVPGNPGIPATYKSSRLRGWPATARP